MIILMQFFHKAKWVDDKLWGGLLDLSQWGSPEVSQERFAFGEWGTLAYCFPWGRGQSLSG